MTANGFRITPAKAVLFFLVAQGMVSLVFRFTRGLGAATNLSNQYPWGLWIGFDVASGVALAAGGFVIAGAVYVFGIKDFKPIARSAILTGFIGYLLVIFGLLADLGRPWNIWRPVFFWQHHSVMFEVAWCVMLYTTVLFLEFLPTILEGVKAKEWARKLQRITVVFAIIGVILSTLHQSSLGSLFLIMPDKMHGLWYTPLLPVFFYVSALAVGGAMVTLESFLSSRALGHRFNAGLLARLNQFTLAALSLYLVGKIADLAYRGNLPLIFEGSLESQIFILEMVIGVIIPILILVQPALRRQANYLFLSSALVVIGVVMNRLDVTIISLMGYHGVAYVPSFIELSVTVGIVSLGVLAFVYISEYFPVFAEQHRTEPATIRVGRPAIANVKGLASHSRRPYSVDR